MTENTVINLLRFVVISAVVMWAIWIFGTGRAEEKRVWDMDSHGNSIIGTDRSVYVDPRPFQLAGPEGGLTYFACFVAFIVALFVIWAFIESASGGLPTGVVGRLILIFIILLVIIDWLSGCGPSVTPS